MITRHRAIESSVTVVKWIIVHTFTAERSCSCGVSAVQYYQVCCMTDHCHRYLPRSRAECVELLAARRGKRGLRYYSTQFQQKKLEAVPPLRCCQRLERPASALSTEPRISAACASALHVRPPRLEILACRPRRRLLQDTKTSWIIWCETHIYSARE